MLFEGTDLDISSALIEAGNKVSEISDVSTLLNRYYQLPPVMAKSYSYLNGTPRLFEFKISEYPISEMPQEEIDGFINLIFNEKLSLNEVKKHSAAEEEAIIYGFYQNSKTIKNLLFEIDLGNPQPLQTHKANTQAGSGYPLQSFCSTHNINAAKRIFATIPIAA